MIEGMGRQAVHLSPEDAIRDIAAILKRVEQGAEIVIERDQHPVAVIQPPLQSGRFLVECVALAEAHGSAVTLDENFGSDLEMIIDSHREPLDATRWD